MKIVNVNDLDIWNVEELKYEFYRYIEDDINSDDIVLEICVGCRGEIDDVKKVNVVDGFFEVNDVDDISKIVFEDIDEDEYDNEEELEESKEYFLDFIFSGFDEVDNKKVYLEGWYEESSSFYVRLK